MHVPAKIGLGACLLGLCFVGGCSKSVPPNIVLITIDTTRADHCSLLGYARDTTPTLRRLADQGVNFDLAYAPSATTGPTHASVLSSLYPIAHGVIKNGLGFDESIETLPEILSEAGYSTAGFVSSFVLDSKFGYSQGFQHYDDEFSEEESTVPYVENWYEHSVRGFTDRRADHTTSRAIAWMKQAEERDGPFFLFIHYMDPHSPYSPPEPFDRTYAPTGSRASQLDQAIALYDGEITFTDREIGRVIDELEGLGIGDETLLVITADHGEGLMNHGHWGHGLFLYEEAVRVPLIVRWPMQIREARTLSEPVELVDVVPTILDLVGLPAIGLDLQGRSLAPALRGETGLETDRAVYLHRRHFAGARIGEFWAEGEKFGMRRGPWKFIEGGSDGEDELYLLTEDAGELSNLASERPEDLARLRQELDAWKEAHRRESSPIPNLAEGDLRRLEALGYTN